MTHKGLVIFLIFFPFSVFAQGLSFNDDYSDKDPYSSFNRPIHNFNMIIERSILRPLAKIYNRTVPGDINDALVNVTNNIKEPLTYINQLMQGKITKSFKTLYRFVTNSVVGIFGIFDIAESLDVERGEEDFGQTLGVWGFDTGPYLVLPFLGPSNVRDTIGKVIDWFTDPFNLFVDYHEDRGEVDEWMEYSYWLLSSFIGYAQNVELFEEIDRSSIDPYATYRNFYMTKRKYDVRDLKINGKSKKQKEKDNSFDFDLNMEDF
jgi:phospholipid-binding lipoprotein MlaA